MLGNKRKDFVEELVVTIVLMLSFSGIVVYFGDIYFYYPSANIWSDFGIIFGVSFFIIFPIIRIIRYAYVFRAYVLLYYPYYILIMILVGIVIPSINDFLKNPNHFWETMWYFIILFFGFLAYTIFIIIERKRGLFKKTIPAVRVQIVRMVLNKIQKLTLVFPDKYLKYLESGDKKYLKKEKH